MRCPKSSATVKRIRGSEAMKTFIEYYAKLGDKHSVCGDRGIIQVDGRLSVPNMDRVALYWGRKRGFGAYRLIRGSSLLSATPICKQIEIPAE